MSVGSSSVAVYSVVSVRSASVGVDSVGSVASSVWGAVGSVLVNRKAGDWVDLWLAG